MRNGRLLRGLAMALLLVGCAAPTEVATVDDGLLADDGTLTDPLGTVSQDGSVADDGALIASPVPDATAAPELVASPAPEGTLVITDLERKNSGLLLWKHCTITAIVTNQASTRLSAEVAFVFRKGGKTVETQHQAIDELAPGDSQTLTVKSIASADDGDVTLGEPTSP